MSQLIDKDYQRGQVELVVCYKVSVLGLQYIFSELLETQWNCIWLTLVTIQKPAANKFVERRDGCRQHALMITNVVPSQYLIIPTVFHLQ